jgi:hypothetical protein
MTVLTRRNLLQGLAAATGLGGCSSLSPSLDLYASSFRGTKQPRGDYPMSDQQIRQLPYATLGVRVGPNSPGVMVLATTQQDEYTWVSADGVIFVTRAGRLIRTRGLKRDLTALDWSTGDPLDALLQGQTFHRTVAGRQSLKLPIEGPIPFEASYAILGETSLRVLGEDIPAQLIEERLDFHSWRWSVTNRYWLGLGSRLIHKTIQQYCPELGPIELVALKSPAATA